jgi:hypothetical protein
MVTGQGFGKGIGGCDKLRPTATGHNWVALFPCPCQLRTVRCMDPGQVTDLLSRAHTCLWERECLYSLVMGSGSFRTDWLEAGMGGGLSTILRPGLKCGVWSPSLDGDLEPMTGVERVGLICAWGASEACVFRATQLGILIRESPFLRDGTAWLRSGTVVRTGSWKMKKWFWLLNPAWL